MEVIPIDGQPAIILKDLTGREYPAIADINEGYFLKTRSQNEQKILVWLDKIKV